jgi:hypothetical protein
MSIFIITYFGFQGDIIIVKIGITWFFATVIFLYLLLKFDRSFKIINSENKQYEEKKDS